MSMAPVSQSGAAPIALNTPGLFRRVASGFYDALILLAIWILATFLIMPFTHSHNLESFYAHHNGIKLIYQSGLLVLGYAFFGGFWTHGGQTIGMRTWRLRVVRLDGAPLDWYRALLRYLAILIPWLLLLLGSELLITPVQQPETRVRQVVGVLIFLVALVAFLWPAFDPRRLAWHDRLSGTRLVLLPQKANAKAD